MTFTWTYSKLDAYETCPRRHYEVDISKHYQDGDGENLKWGNYVHDKLALACSGKAELPEELMPYQKWVERSRRWNHVQVEHRAALTKNLTACNYSAPAVWWRGRVDLSYVEGPLAIALDWKTGRIKENPVQLGITAQWIFAAHPAVEKVISQYVWLGEETTTDETFTRKDMTYLWSKLLPRVQAYEHALNRQEFPPKPGGLCKRYCPVDSCPFWRKGA